METFRCPTCVGVLPDAHARRCGACGQGLRRRHPRVLGEERRIEMRMLPVDRWMLRRLHGDNHRPRVRSLVKVNWHGRFAPSPASAEPDLVMPPVVEPPAPHTIELPAAVDAVEVVGVADVVAEAPVIPPFEDVADITELTPPATVSALDLDMFVAPPASVPPTEPAAEPGPVAAAAPTVTPRPIVAHEELDPDVRALVDELYEQARAELAGFDSGFDTSLPAAEPVRPADAVVDEPPPPAVPEARMPEPLPAPAPEPPAPRTPRAPQASIGRAPANGDVPRAPRGGWVPAFVTEDERRTRLGD